MAQDPPKVASAEWRAMARVRIEWLRKHEMRKEAKMETLLRHLENEIARVKSLVEKENEFL